MSCLFRGSYWAAFLVNIENVTRNLLYSKGVKRVFFGYVFVFIYQYKFMALDGDRVKCI